MHRSLFLSFVVLALGARLVAAAIPAPYNLSVKAIRDTTGSQYMHITFHKPAIPADSSPYQYSYALVRWAGAAPDTSRATQVATFSQYKSTYDTMGTYDDRYTAFNISPHDTTYISATWSYGVFTRHVSGDSTHGFVTDYSTITPLVSATLDTFVITFTKVPQSLSNVHPGDTVSGTFVATEGRTGEVIRYKVAQVNGAMTPYPTVYLDSVTGAFWTVIPTNATPGYLRIAVNANDEQGRTGQTRVYYTYPVPMDTVTITMTDGTTSLLSTRYYYGLVSANPSDSAHPVSAQFNTGMSDSSGHVKIVCQSGAYKLRLEAEGYDALWVNDPNGGTTINNSGSVTVTFSVAKTVSLGGTVTGAGGAALSGATVKLYRAWGPSSAYAVISYTKSDTAGKYSFAMPVGDSLLNTSNAYMQCIGTGYADSVQWYDHTTSYSAKKLIALTGDRSDIDFSYTTKATYYGTLVVYIGGTASQDTVIRSLTYVSIYTITDSSATLYAKDSVTGGRLQTYLPYGKYVLYADPTDTNFLAGYYKYRAYAATWSDGDTVKIGGTSASLKILLSRDSSITSPVIGAPIDGVVRGPSGPISDAHLVLYQVVGSPAGTAGGQKLMKTAATDAYGRYGFTPVPTGLYSIVVDVVGAPQFRIDGIVVDAAGKPVIKDILINISGISDATPLPNAPLMIANYPNPFATSTTVSFRVDAPLSSVDVTLYDVAGRPVSTLVHGSFMRGAHTLAYTTQLAPGVYTCVLRSEGSAVARQIVVAR